MSFVGSKLNIIAHAILPFSPWLHLVPWLAGAIGLGTLAAWLTSYYSGRQPSQDHHRCGWPNRASFGFAALLFTAIAIYGSFVPWNYAPTDWETALERFGQAPYLSLGIGRRADWVANILLFLPLGFCGLAFLTLGASSTPRRVGAFAGVACLLCALSFAIEFCQIWFPPRTISQNDVLAESLGGIAGGLLWLTLGEPLTAWVRTYSQAQRPHNQLDWILQLYFLGFVVYCLLPLDLTISVSELVLKYREGKVQVIPFLDVRATVQDAYQLFRDVVLFVPVGMLAATWKTTEKVPARSLAWGTFLGASLAAGIEIAQLLVYSRHTSVADVILGTLGAFAGVWIIRRWRGETAPQEPVSRSARMAILWLVAAAGYFLVVAAISWAPFEEIVTDSAELKSRYESFFQIPFARMYWGSEFNAIGLVLEKLLLFVPLGCMCCLAVQSLQVSQHMRRVLLIVLLGMCSLGGLGIELMQIFLPSRYSDVTDVILYTVGAILGMAITSRILASRKENDGQQALA